MDSNEAIEAHNRQQRRYYDGPVKPRLLPRDTPYLRRHVEELTRFGNILPGERVLEIGSGMGRYTYQLARKGIKIEALELSPVLLDRMRAFDDGHYEIPLYCADIIKAPQELRGKFDAVIGFFVLHHLHDLERSFTSMTDLLKPSGRLVFLEPNPYNLLYYVQMMLSPTMTWEGDKGILRMRWSIVYDAMRSVGLTAIQMSRFGFFPPFFANIAWGARLEKMLERVGVWRAVLPFQLFRGERL